MRGGHSPLERRNTAPTVGMKLFKIAHFHRASTKISGAQPSTSPRRSPAVAVRPQWVRSVSASSVSGSRCHSAPSGTPTPKAIPARKAGSTSTDRTMNITC